MSNITHFSSLHNISKHANAWEFTGPLQVFRVLLPVSSMVYYGMVY